MTGRLVSENVLTRYSLVLCPPSMLSSFPKLRMVWCQRLLSTSTRQVFVFVVVCVVGVVVVFLEMTCL